MDRRKGRDCNRALYMGELDKMADKETVKQR
jgi:hypothetical protein